MQTELRATLSAATSRPRRGEGRPSANPRHIPAHVRRAVWERDGGQCTFVSEAGHRCEACKALEFDHVLEVARGGEASVDGIRLPCRAHNQYGAEVHARSPEQGEEAEDRDVVPWLRALGFSAAEARRAAERCEDMPDASLEERVRASLSCFRVESTRVVRAGGALQASAGATA